MCKQKIWNSKSFKLGHISMQQLRKWKLNCQARRNMDSSCVWSSAKALVASLSPSEITHKFSVATVLSVSVFTTELCALHMQMSFEYLAYERQETYHHIKKELISLD